MGAELQHCIAYIVVDALCLVETIIVASNVSRDSGSELQVRSFFLLLTANLVFVVFDAVWAALAYSGLFAYNALVLSLVNGINLTAISFAGFFWFFYSLARFDSHRTSKRSMNAVSAFPALLVPVLDVIGYVAGINIIISPEGISYGFLHPIISCVPLMYLLAATIVAAQARKRAKTQADRRISTIFILFMVAPAAAGIFDMFVPDMPVVSAGIMISIMFVIMSMQESRISSDALTGLNNRRRADAFLEESMGNASREHPLCLFIIDMDRFKHINDKYGHLEGDRALNLMADALRRTCAPINAFAARWGGDEFVVIWPDPEKDPASVARTIQDALATVAHDAHVNYSLACTVGWATCKSPDEDRAQLIADADEMLYHNKQDSR